MWQVFIGGAILALFIVGCTVGSRGDEPNLTPAPPDDTVSATVFPSLDTSTPIPAAPSGRRVEIVAKNGAWTTNPPTLVFEPGSRVTFHIEAVDDDYTFTIDSLALNLEVLRGQSKGVDVDLPTVPILLTAYSRSHGRDSSAVAHISVGSPQFINADTRQPRSVFGKCEEQNDPYCLVLIRLVVELGHRQTFRRFLSESRHLTIWREGIRNLWNKGIPPFEEEGLATFETVVDLRRGGARAAIAEPLELGQFFGIRGTSLHRSGEELRVYMVADGGVLTDPARRDSFMTLAGVEGASTTTIVTMRETEDHSQQFIGTLDPVSDLGAAAEDVIWINHPQRRSVSNGKDVLDGMYPGRR